MSTKVRFVRVAHWLRVEAAWSFESSVSFNCIDVWSFLSPLRIMTETTNLRLVTLFNHVASLQLGLEPFIATPIIYSFACVVRYILRGVTTLCVTSSNLSEDSDITNTHVHPRPPELESMTSCIKSAPARIRVTETLVHS